MTPADHKRVQRNTGFEPATVEQKATAALAGWRVEARRISWVVRDPDGGAVNCYAHEDEGWAAAWAVCSARAEAAEVGQGAKGTSSWWAGWKVFRDDQRINAGFIREGSTP